MGLFDPSGPFYCPICGKKWQTMDQVAHCTHGSGSKTCPTCNGTGQIVNFLAPNTTCPTCGGTGQVPY